MVLTKKAQERYDFLTGVLNVKSVKAQRQVKAEFEASGDKWKLDANEVLLMKAKAEEASKKKTASS